MRTTVPRIMFAAIASGSGKTTLTCAVLQALINRGLVPAAFKGGPDYIDPMFHREIIGTHTRNLDLFMLSEDVCKYLLAVNSAPADIAVLEGVMGYYDGLGGRSTEASSYHLASVTGTPVILIVDCRGASLSLAALISGFARFRPDSGIKGVILNNLSTSLYQEYKEMLEAETGLPVVGYFPHLPECSLKSRHLGLITPPEVDGLKQKVTFLAKQAEQSLDLDMLLTLARQASELNYPVFKIKKGTPITIGVAKDEAFCFYYQDSLELLEKMGAVICFFSPLHDQTLPACDGIILGGGYPELYAEKLAANISMHQSLKHTLESGIPCLAEGGGYVYLLDTLVDKEGREQKMTGFLSGKAKVTSHLSRFGYLTLRALKDNPLCAAGETIKAHEFHYSDSSDNGDSFRAVKPISGKSWNCIHSKENVVAGYPHLHFWSNIDFAYAFLEKCRAYNLCQEK
ncbi:MAG: cobyrinate a,c-diamide synthase [Peptococcaceae bacterium]|nr:cobyrinate a,c-diamide synthase [Peptococcaceae bacterium]